MAKRNIGWEYGFVEPDDETGIVCGFCENKLRGGGVTRFKEHLVGVGNDVTSCTKVIYRNLLHDELFLGPHDEEDHDDDRRVEEVGRQEQEVRRREPVTSGASSHQIEIQDEDDETRAQRDLEEAVRRLTQDPNYSKQRDLEMAIEASRREHLSSSTKGVSSSRDFTDYDSDLEFKFVCFILVGLYILLILTQTSHARYLKLGIIPTIDTHLIRDYCYSKEFQHARLLFDEISNWDLVSTTTIIGHFAHHDRHQDAITLFSRMLYMDIRPNEYTFGTVIHSSTSLRALNVGKQLQAIAMKMGFCSNVFVGSSFVDLYVKLSTIEDARKAFEDTHHPNVVSYTSLICGYLKNERFEDAQMLFSRMPERNVISWNAMIAANIAALGMGKSFHACAFKLLGKYGVFVGNSLISFYAKCGNMEDSLLAFYRLHGKNTVSWNAIISGYAQNGKGKEALDFFQKMQFSGIRPNGVTLLCVLLACNHAGLVDEGYACFNLAQIEYPSVLRAEHYACMVDLLSRSGRFGEAEKFLQELPFNPGIGFWKALLGGCQIHSNMKLAELAVREIHALDPEDVSSYVMLSNASSAAGKWQSASLIRKEMKDKGMQRIPGCSWIEISGKVHVFTTRDKRHCEIDEVYTIMGFCLEHLKAIPNFNLFPED
ncbi:hypothetical protein AQUCO_01000688v1 [Aquilegia coerulea]|uniref:BED-type domain-containing protein n=1 Tax=Aquilegia coerulea TaxID=218851 RepID=A0A2G5EBP4_AQUCA|nr:hypothetical protein AQUCO_01000688v1 [Aquilegia coerulea]